jgi:hypothetical protein
VSTAPAADTSTRCNQHKHKPEQRSTPVDYLDFRTTEDIATDEDAAYVAALALLNGEY